MFPFLKEYFETMPLGYPLAMLIWHTLWNHILYRSIINFLFEKPLTKRQKRELRKVPYLKRTRMSFKRKIMSDLPQDFSPNIEKYYKLDIFSLVFGVVAAVAVTVIYLTDIKYSAILIMIICGLNLIFTVGTWVWYFIHHTFRDKNGKFDGALHGDMTFK